MLTLYVQPNDPKTETLTGLLKDECLAFKLVELDGVDAKSEEIQSVPALKDGKSYFYGLPEMRDQIDRIIAYKRQWDRFQGDSCYCGDDGDIL